MIVKLNTGLIPLFSGTYESIYWEVQEWDDDGEEVGVDYDPAEMLDTISHEYDNHVDYINEEMDIPWFNIIGFKGHYSPREYNFSTDVLDFTAKIDKRAMLAYLKTLEKSEEFTKYLHDEFSSRDGFWSYTPDNYADLLYQLKYEKDEFEQAIGALVTYASKATEDDIESEIHEDWAGNGYGGLNYKISEE